MAEEIVKGDDVKPADAGAGQSDQISKADFDKYVAENEKLKQDLEETRMEIMTPEYLEYLNSRDGKQPEKKEAPAKSAEVDFSKLTPAEIYAKAKEDAKAEIKEDLDKIKSEVTSNSQAQVQREVAQFSRTHSDFEQFRPLMYGLSLDPKHKDLSLGELYEKAKEHVARIHVPASPDEKRRQAKLSGEKPGHSTGSFKADKKYTDQSAAEESWDEIVGEGSLPPAI